MPKPARVKTILEDSGFTVLTASNGDQALEVFRQRAMDIHAVLLDVIMPGKDAAEVLEEIQKSRPEAKVVVCSGYNDHEAAGRLGGRAPTAFLRKPYDPKSLLSRIKEIW